MSAELTNELKTQAESLGFVLSGVVLAAAPGRLAHFQRWLDSGFAGEMSYLSERRDAYAHPAGILEGCRSLLMLGLPYLQSEAQRSGNCEITDGVARVARYAQGERDYHDVIHGKLKELKRWLLLQAPHALVRGVVDTAPLLEREFAEAAGLGWVGKNTLLLNRNWGSYFFIAALLTDLELVPDEPVAHSYCGTCTACLDACPTKAFVQPYVLDARRCLSYLTIEHRSGIAEDLMQLSSGWLFGCDICQEVCPWNRKSSLATEEELGSEVATMSVTELLGLNEEAFKRLYRKTPLWRSKRRGIVRNAILLAGSQQLVGTRRLLVALLSDPEVLLRAAAAWALGQLGGTVDREALDAAIGVESDLSVRLAITQALERLKT